jgi:hypothetical protein
MTSLPASVTQIESIEERNNRLHKARLIADALWPHVEPLAMGPQIARMVVRGLGDAARLKAAQVAGYASVSPKTWAVVTTIIVHRVEHPVDVDDDPFEGLPQ